MLPKPLRLKDQAVANRSVNFSQNSMEIIDLQPTLATHRFISYYWSDSLTISKTNSTLMKVLQKAAVHVIMMFNLGNIVTSHFTKFKIMPLKMLFSYRILKLNCF